MTKLGAEIVWFLGVLIWYVIRYPFDRRMRWTPIAVSLLDRREQVLLLIASLGLFFVPFFYVSTGVPALFDRPFSPSLAALGAAVMAAALWLFRRSHADLGRNWSVSLELRPTHTLVTKGVYRFVRHPMYSSFLLLALAQFLLLANWLAGGIGMVAIVAVLMFRIGREERMMLAHFGEDYRAYMARTKRLIPYVW
jgi:protein-S-isoprenylcysteine O-methyltransferase Ste14